VLRKPAQLPPVPEAVLQSVVSHRIDRSYSSTVVFLDCGRAAEHFLDVKTCRPRHVFMDRYDAWG
jgi:hypothetical protein